MIDDPMKQDFATDGPFSNIFNRLNIIEKWIREHITEVLSSSGAEVVGAIKMYGGAAAPTGYLLCDGTSYLRTDYADLFTAIGTTYGSADATHFNVPDLRGRTPIGVGTGIGGGASGVGLPAGGSALTAVALAGWKGEETHTLITAEMPTHNHTVASSGDGGSGGVLTDRLPTSSFNTGNAGSGSAHNNIQPVMGVNFIIKT